MEVNFLEVSGFFEVIIFALICLILFLERFKSRWWRFLFISLAFILYLQKDIKIDEASKTNVTQVFYSSRDVNAYQTDSHFFLTYKKPTLNERSPEFKQHTKHYFDKVMFFLMDLSKKTGIDYQSLNVIIYCFLIPIFLFFSIFANIKFFKFFNKRNK